MPNIITDITPEDIANGRIWWDKLSAFRTDPSWLNEVTLTSPTRVPGVFYHGSTEVNITEFKAQIEGRGSIGTEGVFFTENPTYAALYVTLHCSRRSPVSGRIYAVELDTRNPLLVNSDEWLSATASGRHVEAARCAQAKLDGFDSIATSHNEGTITEIIALYDDVVKRRGDDIGTPTVPTIFYQALDDPDCASLFSDRKCDQLKDISCRAVAVDARLSIYCPRGVWPKMDFELLRLWTVDCLIDPSDGSALVLDPARIVPLNRAERRLRAKSNARGYRGPFQSQFASS